MARQPIYRRPLLVPTEAMARFWLLGLDSNHKYFIIEVFIMNNIQAVSDWRYRTKTKMI